jgi:hypothetical protein
MLTKIKLVLIAASFFFCLPLAIAETKRPIETRNAALRYWMAFAELQDPPADKGTADLLEKTASGDAAWDEAKLGPIVDKNEEAILAMQRASKLPECDWGLEYDRGPGAAIAYVPRARVLARLNTLYGMRLAANGKTEEAIDTWLAGIRLSQHLTRGGGLIFSLIAKMTLLSNFNALTQSAQSGKWNGLQRKRVEDVLRAMPETGFDWSEALWYEQGPLDIGVKQMKEAANPRAYYEELTGKPAAGFFQVPTASDMEAFHQVMGAAEATLRLPPDQAQDRLRALQESVKTLHPFYRETTPSFTRINEARAEVQAARQTLLSKLYGKR